MSDRITLKKVIRGLLLCAILIFNVQQVQAADYETVSGTCEYDKAYEVLELVNKQRQKNGADILAMDKDLLEAAMLRAAECTVLFSHTRPNGTICFEVSDKMYGENIAMGQGSASSVMTDWMNSSGHRANILNSGYSSIGIGCFKKNGTLYWVQCFGYGQADEGTQPKNADRKYKVAMTGGNETTIVSVADEENPLKTKVSNLKVTAAKKKFTVKWKQKSGIDGYQLQVSTNKSFVEKDSYNISKKSTKKTIIKYNGKKLKAKKKYYIRIRAYAQGTNANGVVEKQYSKWKTISKKTK